MAARTWQPVQERGARATAVGVVLLAARGRVRTDEHQPPVVDQRLVLWLTSGWAVLPSVTTDHVQRLEALKLLGAAAPRVRPPSSSRTFRKQIVDGIQVRLISVSSVSPRDKFEIGGKMAAISRLYRCYLATIIGID